MQRSLPKFEGITWKFLAFFCIALFCTIILGDISLSCNASLKFELKTIVLQFMQYYMSSWLQNICYRLSLTPDNVSQQPFFQFSCKVIGGALICDLHVPCNAMNLFLLFISTLFPISLRTKNCPLRNWKQNLCKKKLCRKQLHYGEH